MAGEMDIAVRRDLDAELRRVLDVASTMLLDLNRTTYIDATCVTVLLGVEAIARAEGKGFRIIGAHRAVRRTLDIVRLGERLHLEPLQNDQRA